MPWRVLAVLALLSDSTAGAERSGKEVSTVDLAEQQHRPLWSAHPAIGEASFDNFERIPGNPVYTGTAPFEWPVNGFLFKDPVSAKWSVYVALYHRGYFGRPSECGLIQSSALTGPWENKGVVLKGDPATFDGNGTMAGHTPDVTMCCDNRAYYLLYDYGREDHGDCGLALARADKPEGPFTREAKPIISQNTQRTLLGWFGCTYGGTLFRREKDWLIVAATSVGPGNKGGTWAMVGMKADRPEGPYSEPVLLLYPQSKMFFTSPAEFFPAFAHDGFVYAPAASLANRNLQTVYRARLEDALDPDKWNVFQYGSCFHAEPVPQEAWGIWGQTFSGLVDQDGSFVIMFPSKNTADTGTINLARRPWDKPYRNGFAVSAPESRALSIFQREFCTFRLEAHVRSNGPKNFVWNHAAPLGTDRVWHAGGSPHALTLAAYTVFSLHGGGWMLQQVAPDGARTVLAQGAAVKSQGLQTDAIGIEQGEAELKVRVNGQDVWRGAVRAQRGSIGFLAEKGSTLFVDKLPVSTEGAPCSKFLLPTDGITGAGNGDRGWAREEHGNYKYGFGYYSDRNGQTAKWNYVGGGFALWSPRTPQGGICEVWLDGQRLG